MPSPTPITYSPEAALHSARGKSVYQMNLPALEQPVTSERRNAATNGRDHARRRDESVMKASRVTSARMLLEAGLPYQARERPRPRSVESSIWRLRTEGAWENVGAF